MLIPKPRHRVLRLLRSGAPAAAVVAVTFSGACAGEGNDAHHYETTHFEVSAHTPICAGTLDIIESEAQRIASALQLTLHSDMKLHLGPDTNDDCNYDGQISGCADGFGASASASSELWSVPHELVHLVRKRHRIAGPDLFEEGLGRVLSGGPLVASHTSLTAAAVEVGPSELLASPSHAFFDENDGTLIGAHFIGWMRTAYGDERVFPWFTTNAYRDASGVTAVNMAFQDYFGESLESAEASWRMEADVAYEFGGPCAGTEVVELADAPFHFDGRLDCSDAGTVGPYGVEALVSTLPVCVRAPSTSDIEVSMDGPPGAGAVLEDFHGCAESADAREAQVVVGPATSRVLAPHGCSFLLRARVALGEEPAMFAIRIELARE